MVGRFMSFEGGEGCGKTTHIKRLARQLELLGQPCLITREPGGTPIGEKIRGLFLDQKLDLKTETLLMLAARRIHVRSVILPALAKGLWVLCDRYIDSHMVYQAVAHDKSHHWILALHKNFDIHILPDVTFLFQDPVAIALNRRRANKDNCNRFDQASFAFHQKIRKGFAFLAKTYPERIVSVPQRQSLRAGTEFLLKTLRARWPEDFPSG